MKTRGFQPPNNILLNTRGHKLLETFLILFWNSFGRISGLLKDLYCQPITTQVEIVSVCDVYVYCKYYLCRLYFIFTTKFKRFFFCFLPRENFPKIHCVKIPLYCKLHYSAIANAIRVTYYHNLMSNELINTRNK